MTGSNAVLAVTEVSGLPTFSVVATGTFDGAESFRLTFTVPSGLAGTIFTMQVFSLGPGGGLIDSGKERVTIRS